METCIDYVDHTVAVVSTDEAKWHRRLREYKAKFPDSVRIKTEPENNDGCMVAEVPVNWIKIKPPIGLSMTDEERARRAESMREGRKNARISDASEGGEDG